MTSTEEKLKHAREWMQRQVAEERNIISSKMRNEENIITQLKTYFPPEVFISFSKTHIKELIGSELLFDLQSEHTDIDGSSIILWYQKVFDSLIEHSITKWYRRFLKKNWKLPKPKNSPLEKALFQVSEKDFILSSWRLYELLKNIELDTHTYFYEWKFREYLNSIETLKKYLRESDFLLHLETLMKKKILWEKRHSGIVSRKDTIFARQKYIWKLKEKNSLLGILTKLWSVEL